MNPTPTVTDFAALLASLPAALTLTNPTTVAAPPVRSTAPTPLSTLSIDTMGECPMLDPTDDDCDPLGLSGCDVETLLIGTDPDAML